MTSSISPVTLPGTEVRLLESKIVGDSYKLFISLPANYGNSKRRYPAVYLTDGNALFPLVRFLTESLSADWELPRVLLIGIGYDSDDPLLLARIRERDYLPTPGDQDKRRKSPRYSFPRGRAAAFLRFIRQELKRFINANYLTDPADSTYLGVSHGGLFGLYTLFHRPDTFARYVIGSPSIHHDHEIALEYERAYAASNADLPVRLMLSAGGREEKDDPLIRPSFRFVTNVKRLAKTLQERNYPGLKLTTRIFNDESHVSVIPATFSSGLRAVFD